jgi:hypothetical protein
MAAISAGDVPTLNQNTTGSAATLTTARAIYGNNFDGSAALTQAIAGTYGGTGVNNGANTITIAGNVTHAGAFTQTFTATANTSLTLPVTGTLATLAGSEALSNKTITASAFNGTVGATTASTGAFTTLSATGAITGGTVGGIGIQLATDSAIRQVGASGGIMYFDTATGGATNGIFRWRSSSSFTTFATLGSTGLEVTGALSSTGNADFGTTISSARITLGHVTNATVDNSIVLRAGSTKTAWQIGAQFNVDNGFEITPSTAAGGTTFSTPVAKFTSTGLAVTGVQTITSTTAIKLTLTGGSNQNAIQLNAGGTSGAHAFYVGAGSDLIVGNDKGFAILDATSNFAGRLFIDATTGVTSIYVGLNLPFLGTGIVYSNAGALTSTNPSDARLKTDITDIGYGLSSILALRPVSYKWKSDTVNQGTQFGFIAQEVQQVMPDLVKEFDTTEDGETVTRLGLEKEGIYAALVKSVQELNANLVAQVAALSQRLAALETK